jgi:hypothetical protein
MTDAEVQPATPMKPRARTRPPARRAPPPLRTQPNGHHSVDLAEQVAAMQAKIDELEKGRVTFVQSEPPPAPDTRVADPESLSPWMRQMLERTHDVPVGFEAANREPSYNYPERLYLKPDGTVVSLQGDPGNRAYYTDKGFHCLSREEAADFRKNEYPRWLAETRRKAHLITTIRRMFSREPSLIGFRDDQDYDVSLNLMSIAQLEDEWDDLRKRSINPGQKLPPMPRFKSDQEAADKRLMAGVETRPPRVAREKFESSLPDIPRRSREIEVTKDTIGTFA